MIYCCIIVYCYNKKPFLLLCDKITQISCYNMKLSYHNVKTF